MAYEEDGPYITKITFDEQLGANIEAVLNVVFVLVEYKLPAAAMSTRTIREWTQECAFGANPPAQKATRTRTAIL